MRISEIQASDFDSMESKVLDVAIRVAPEFLESGRANYLEAWGIRLVAIFLSFIAGDRAEFTDIAHPITDATPAVVDDRVRVPEGRREPCGVQIGGAMWAMQLMIEGRDRLHFFWTDIWAQHAHASNRPFVE